MITVTSPANARILVIGNDNLTDAVIQNLRSKGVNVITLMNDEGSRKASHSEHFVKKDALEHIAADVEYFKSFSLVLALNQPRELELALSDARWPMGEMQSSKFVSLPMDLLPWTYAKRLEIAAVIEQEFPLELEDNKHFRAYLAAGRAFAEFQKSQGTWPTAEVADKVQALAAKAVPEASADVVGAYINQMCNAGLGSVPETIELLARLISTDAMKLITGSGHPINNVNVEEAIIIATTTYDM
ncbi:hypothetical protein Sste5346_004815 [Sporothrix stenoceras]|uniref:Uncharacterized protein n=1 Tax=Sporothrix stenoceras TaxID=5173 RepID=A0ABR3Z621_9PEZI